MSELNIGYIKRKNAELFESLQHQKNTFVKELQNYIPVYDKLFALNETNYNSINLNHQWYLNKINKKTSMSDYIYNCDVKNVNTNKIKKTNIFVKMAPLLDPFKYITGKYNITTPGLFQLPEHSSMNKICHSKIMDNNNTAYIDGLFSYLSGQLIEKHNYVHGVEYYGSFIGIKQMFKADIIDDIDYLHKSDFFRTHKDKLFQVEEYEHMLSDDEDSDEESSITKKRAPIKIDKNISMKSVEAISNFLYDDIFLDNSSNLDETLSVERNIEEIPNNDGNGTNTGNGTGTDTDTETGIIHLKDLTNYDFEQIYQGTNNESKGNTNGETTDERLICEQQITTLKSSSSTCSSRTSNTSRTSVVEHVEGTFDIQNDTEKTEKTEINSEESWSDCSDSDVDSDAKLYVTIPEFPVQMICMEHCDNTFDDLIMNNDLSQEEWFSALMQIIMILLVCQNTFSFTHNDLHTNNIMYVNTDKKFIYYCYKNKYYKVPTFGRIYKMIDFGRAIFKYKGVTMCSDSFKPGEDAATQYNIEPYFNNKKPRLEPNYSFDLCRLACSIYDYLIDDDVDVKKQDEWEPIAKLIYEWVLDDKKINVLYKLNGEERYPDFKLYKMISRLVHNHTPEKQLERKEFSHYLVEKSSITDNILKKHILNLDIIPNMSRTENKN